MTEEPERIQPGQHSKLEGTFYNSVVDPETGIMTRTWKGGRVETMIPVIFGWDRQTREPTVIYESLRGV